MYMYQTICCRNPLQPLDMFFSENVPAIWTTYVDIYMTSELSVNLDPSEIMIMFLITKLRWKF